MRESMWKRVAAVVATAVVLQVSIAAGSPSSGALAVELDARPGKTMLSGGALQGANTVIAAEGTTVYTAWQDRRYGQDGGAGITFRRSLDGGRTWQDHRVISQAIDAQEPAIAASGDHVYVAWVQGTAAASTDRGRAAVYFAASHNRGTTFGAAQRVDMAAPSDSTGVRVVAAEERVIVTWYDQHEAVWVATSTDGGTWFETPSQVATGLVHLGAQPIAIDGGIVAVAWDRQLQAESTEREVDVAVSRDGGLTFEPAFNVSEGAAGTSHSAAVAVSAGVIDVVWGEQTDVIGTDLDDNAIVARRSRDEGDTWEPIEQLGSATPAYPSGQPTIATDGETVAVAWLQAGTRRTQLSTAAVDLDGWGAPTMVTGPMDEPPTLATVRPAADGGPHAAFEWTMPERFGSDLDGDGLIDYDTSFGYVNTASFQVDLDACDSRPAGHGFDELTFTWVVDGIEVADGPGCRLAQELSEGSHPVHLTVTQPDGTADEVQRDIEVEDRLIVSVGDSVASGEGNPDIPGTGPWPWSDESVWQNRQCNRSAWAGPARAADLLEHSDDQSSVTFVHLACSGASVLGPDDANGGLLTPYAGINPAEGDLLAPQLDQLDQLVVGRDVDALLVSIGANDLHFSGVVAGCIAESGCDDPNGEIAQQLGTRFAELPAHYQALNDRIAALGIPADRVFITEYFDPTTDETGAINLRCVANADSIPGLEGATDTETRWARTAVVQELNRALTAAAEQYGWHVVTGIEQAFIRHGYCSENESWVVNLGGSFTDQGDKNGSFHPNRIGHAWYGRRIAETVSALQLPPVEGGDAPVDPNIDTRAEFYVTTADRSDVYVSALASTGSGLEPVRITNVSQSPTITGATMPRIVATEAGAWLAWTEAVTDGAGIDKYQAFAGRVAAGGRDLTLGAVSMIQAPDGAGSLVAGKGTAVRAVVGSTLEDQQVVRIAFTVTDSSGQVVVSHDLPVSLAPGENRLFLQPPGGAILPPPGETLTATVEVDSQNWVSEHNEANNMATSVPTSVSTSRAARILFVPLRGVACNAATGVADAAERWLGATYPIADGDLVTDTSCSTTLPNLSLADGPSITRSLAVLDRLARMSGYDHVVGVVPHGALSSVGNAAGIGLVGSNDDAGQPAAGVLVELGNGPSVVAHEVGHNLGVDHTEQLLANGYWVDGHVEQRGTDFMDDTVQPQPWVSQPTFDRLLLRLQLTGGGGGGALAASGEVLVVSGTVVDGGSFSLEPFYRQAGTPDVALGDEEWAPVRVQYRDAGGAVLGTAVVPLSGVAGTGDVTVHAQAFAARVPWVDGASEIAVLNYLGDVVATRSVSGASPTVTVTGPAAGSTLSAGGSLVASWDADDADGDALTATVEVSLDNATWRPLATDVNGDRVAVPVARDLVGSDVRIRVTVTDGVNSSSATSEPFRVDAGPTPPEERFAVVRNTEESSLSTATTSVWTMHPDGTDLRLVTDALASVWDVDWSPDGERIAFWSSSEVDDAGAGTKDIFTVAIDGTGLTNLTSALPGPTADRSCPDWSPDGTRIAFLERPFNDWRTYVQVIDLATSAVTTAATIENAPLWATCPRFSPAGSHIVFEDGGHVFVTELASGTVAEVWARTDGAVEALAPSWTPDGRVLLATGEPGRDGVWSVGPDGTDPQLHVTPFEVNLEGNLYLYTLAPKASADGSRIYFRTQVSASTGADGFGPKVRLICSTYLDGSDRQCAQDEVLSRLGGGFVDADWSPVDVVVPAPPAAEPLPEPAAVDAGGPYTAVEDAAGTVLSAGGTLLGDEIPAAAWDLDGDGEFDDAVGLSPDVTFVDGGDQQVAVRFTLADGSTATDTATVTVVPSPAIIPDHDATWFTVGEPITVTARFEDPGHGSHTVSIGYVTATVVEDATGGTASVVIDAATSGGIIDLPIIVCDDDGTTCGQGVAPVFITDSTAPVLWEVGPQDGPVAGGTAVALDGVGLAQVDEVRFGDVVVPFTRRADGRLEVVAPPSPSGNPGTVEVTVTGPGGTSTPDDYSTFTYRAGSAPVASDVTATIEGDSGVVVLVATDADGDPISFRVVEPPAHGSVVSIDGAVALYVPDVGYAGDDHFTFAAADSLAEGPAATATVRVGNRPPVPAAPHFTASADGSLDLSATDLVAGATDPDGDAVRVGSVFGVATTAGRVVFDGTAAVFAAAAGFSGETTFEFEVVDGRGGVGVGTATVLVPDRQVDEAPIVDAGPAVSGVEGSPVDVVATVVDDLDAATVTWSVDDGTGCAFADDGLASTIVTCTDDGTFTLTVTADDGVNQPVSATTTLVVANADPTVTITSPSDGTEVQVGEPLTFTATVADPGADTLVCGFDWGSGEPTSVTAVTGTCAATYTFEAVGSPTVTVEVRDDDGGTASTTRTVLVQTRPDAPPTVDAGPARGTSEGASVAVTATVADDHGPVTVVWSSTPGEGVDPGAVCTFADANASSTTVRCTDDGTWTLTATASDGVNPPVADTADLIIAGSSPTVVIVDPVAGAAVPAGTEVLVRAHVADAGANDTVVCRFAFGDGATTEVASDAGVCTAGHTWAAGSTTITVTALDDDGLTSSRFVDITVTTNSAARVFAGGAVLGPEPALIALAAPGQPSNRLFFQLLAGDGFFSARTPTSATVNGRTAAFSGTGMWNRHGAYRYEVTVTDGGTGLLGLLRDRVAIRIISPTGVTVWSTGGNVPVIGGVRVR